MQELERGDSGVRSFVSVHSSLAMYPIYAFGSDEQKKTWLPVMQKGEKIGCFGLTEPDFGSNPGGMRTNARKDGDSWVLNGAKSWITSGSIADVAIIWAKVGERQHDPRLSGQDRSPRLPRRGHSASGRCGLRSRPASLQDVHIPESIYCKTGGRNLL
jgi:glutaryl-CoA dehydrogenase